MRKVLFVKAWENKKDKKVESLYRRENGLKWFWIYLMKRSSWPSEAHIFLISNIHGLAERWNFHTLSFSSLLNVPCHTFKILKLLQCNLPHSMTRSNQICKYWSGDTPCYALITSCKSYPPIITLSLVECFERVAVQAQKATLKWVRWTRFPSAKNQFPCSCTSYFVF